MGARLLRTGTSGFVGFFVVLALGMSMWIAYFTSAPGGAATSAYPGTTTTTTTVPPGTTSTSTETTSPTTVHTAGSTTSTTVSAGGISTYGSPPPPSAMSPTGQGGSLPFTGASALLATVAAAILVDVGILMVGFGRPRRRVQRT
jgi:hypothetical protein